MAEDLELRVSVEGAKEGEAALKGVASAEQEVGQGAEGTQKAAESGKDLGQGFSESAKAANLLSRGLGEIGIQVPGLNLILQSLLSSAINPVTLGIVAGILAVRGLTAAFEASAAATEEERQRLETLAEGYAKIAGGMEKYLRMRKDLATATGERQARHMMYEVGAAGGLEDEATALAIMEGAVGTQVDPRDVAAAWNSSEFPEHLRNDPPKALRWFARQTPEKQRAMKEESAARAQSTSTISLRQAEWKGKIAREGETFTPIQQIKREYRRQMDVSSAEAEQTFEDVAPVSWGTWLFSGLYQDIRRQKAHGRVQEFMQQRGREEALQEESGGVLNVKGDVYYGGVNFSGAFEDPAGRVPRSARR